MRLCLILVSSLVLGGGYTSSVFKLVFVKVFLVGMLTFFMFLSFNKHLVSFSFFCLLLVGIIYSMRKEILTKEVIYIIYKNSALIFRRIDFYMHSQEREVAVQQLSSRPGLAVGWLVQLGWYL